MRRPRWWRRRPAPDATQLEEARAKLRQAEVGWQVAQCLGEGADRVHGRLSEQLLENHIGPKIHNALTGGL